MEQTTETTERNAERLAILWRIRRSRTEQLDWARAEMNAASVSEDGEITYVFAGLVDELQNAVTEVDREIAWPHEPPPGTEGMSDEQIAFVRTWQPVKPLLP